ncbi:MAG: hypothetical protein JXB13_11425 [Phycisphaerae bacterium]|nr:hypothetical protein [Phycisphaerae bacterium]
MSDDLGGRITREERDEDFRLLQAVVTWQGGHRLCLLNGKQTGSFRNGVPRVVLWLDLCENPTEMEKLDEVLRRLCKMDFLEEADPKDCREPKDTLRKGNTTFLFMPTARLRFRGQAPTTRGEKPTTSPAARRAAGWIAVERSDGTMIECPSDGDNLKKPRYAITPAGKDWLEGYAGRNTPAGRAADAEALRGQAAPAEGPALTEAERPQPTANKATEGASQGDTPGEQGYVESPVDPKAYRPATEIVSEHTPAGLRVTMRNLRTILENYATNHVRWTRPLSRSGRPVPNRRSVHLGDWAAYLRGCSNPESEGFPRLTEAELDRRKAAVRDTRHAGK